MKTLGATMKKQSKGAIEAEVEQLRGIALALYRCLENQETPESKKAKDDFIKYIMEKV